jgi:ribosomal protection tetracycline resistance protein
MEAFCRMHALNLGILAHVDAGKTSLTERILFETGVISEVGRVDHGTTQTDTLELERQRGITIQSAVASFRLDDLTVNLIDTPGHPDFIAEVGRALRVLDAVIVVISAVEGVQSQTRRLVQAVRSSGIPLLLFINKIDRTGARGESLLAEIKHTLGLCPLALSTVSELGTRSASVNPHDFVDQTFAAGVLDVLAEHSDTVIAQFLSGGDAFPLEMLRAEFTRQFHGQQVVPTFHGSAITGAGVSHLLHELPRLVGAAHDRSNEELSGMVFKIQRTSHCEKIGLVRLFAGRLAVREHVILHRTLANGQQTMYEARITGIERYRPGMIEVVSEAHAGDIVRVHGVPELQIDDVLGQVLAETSMARFQRPTLESVVRAVDPGDETRLYAALEQLEEQDPLISVRSGHRDTSISLRLYGEVQKEVIEATLRNDYGLPVHFGTSQTICIERVVGFGTAAEGMGGANPFAAAVGLSVEPGAPLSGITYRRELGSLPPAFYRAIEETVYDTLREGLLGWEVHDCVVTLTQVGYSSVASTAGDFRKLAPLVLMQALKRAGTEVCEPIERFTLEVPQGSVGEAFGALSSARATPEETAPHGDVIRIIGKIPSSKLHGFEQHLPALAHGDAAFTSGHQGYRTIRGRWPERARTDFDPLNRKLYLALVSQS